MVVNLILCQLALLKAVAVFLKAMAEHILATVVVMAVKGLTHNMQMLAAAAAQVVMLVTVDMAHVLMARLVQVRAVAAAAVTVGAVVVMLLAAEEEELAF